jgi:Tol biopolymer transport system component
LVVITIEGKALGNLALGTFDTPAISPDLATLAYGTDGARFAFLDLVSGAEILFEPFDMVRWRPSWSPVPDLLTVNGVNDAETIQPQIGIIDTSEMTYTRLVQWSEGQHEPAWSPDGGWIAFSSDKLRPDLSRDLFILDTSCLDDHLSCETAIDGPLVRDTAFDFSSPFWSPDSELLGSICSSLDTQGICVVDPATRSVDSILMLEGGTTYLSPPAWSPDGRWIAISDPSNDRTGLLDPVSGDLFWIHDLPFAFWIDIRARDD